MRHTTGSKRSGRAVNIEALEERQLFAAPTAQFIVLSPTNPAGATYFYNVKYTGNPAAINSNSLDNFDTQVSGPSGTLNGTLVSVVNNGAGSFTAQYSVPPPPMPGTYTVQLLANEVFDTTGQAVAGSPLGQFQQLDTGQTGGTGTDKVSPTAALIGVPKADPSGNGYLINVSYTDDVDIQTTTIGNGDILVSGPGGFTELGQLVAITNNTKGLRIVQYRVPNPIFQGVYSITTQPGEVSDTSNNFVQPSTLGTFNAGFVNTGAGGTGVPTGGGPSFASPDVSAAVTDIPESVATLGKGKVTVRITNLGDNKTPVRFKIAVFLSDNRVLGSADPMIGEFLINRRLDGGQSKSFKVNVKFPDVPAGNYVVAALADSSGVLKEPNETNNVGFSTNTVTVKVPNVDLAPTFVSDLPTEVVGGDPGRVTLNIANKGTANFAAGANITLYASADNVLDTTIDPVVRQISGLPLRIGHNSDKNVRIDFNYPTNLPDGNYKLIATVDAGSSLDTDTTNNTSVTTGQVFIRRAFIDLRADTISVTSGPLKVGANNTVEVKVTNLGNVTASGPLGISLAAISPNLAGQVPLIKVVRQARLGPAGSRTATQTFRITFQLPPTLPSSQSPGYFFQATLDPDQVFAETDETNNVVTTLNPFPTR